MKKKQFFMSQKRHVAYLQTKQKCIEGSCEGIIVEKIERINEQPLQMKSTGRFYCNICTKKPELLPKKRIPENLPTNLIFIEEPEKETV